MGKRDKGFLYDSIEKGHQFPINQLCWHGGLINLVSKDRNYTQLAFQDRRQGFLLRIIGEGRQLTFSQSFWYQMTGITTGNPKMEEEISAWD